MVKEKEVIKSLNLIICSNNYIELQCTAAKALWNEFQLVVKLSGIFLKRITAEGKIHIFSGYYTQEAFKHP